MYSSHPFFNRSNDTKYRRFRMKMMGRVTLVAVAFAALSQFNAQTAEAGIFKKLFGCKKAACCCEPEPVCCEPEPEPVCCEPAPEPVCCEPAPEPVCCEPAPEPVCCEPAPEPACCEPEPAPEPCCASIFPAPELAEGEVLVWISPILTPIAKTEALATMASSPVTLVATTSAKMNR